MKAATVLALIVLTLALPARAAPSDPLAGLTWSQKESILQKAIERLEAEKVAVLTVEEALRYYNDKVSFDRMYYAATPRPDPFWLAEMFYGGMMDAGKRGGWKQLWYISTEVHMLVEQGACNLRNKPQR